MITAPKTVRSGNGSAKRARLIQAIRVLESSSDRAPRRRVALAEAEFRLAILPDTTWKESIERLQKAILYDPFHPKYFFHLGRLYHRNGDYRGAVFEYRHALKLAPASHRTCVHLALALLELDETEKAIGRDVIESLARGSEQDLNHYIREIDSLLENGRTKNKNDVSVRKRKPPPSSEEEDPKGTTGCRWRGVWRVALIDQLCRPRPIPKQIDKYLASGAQGANGSSSTVEYTVVCLLLLINHDSAKTIRQKLEERDTLSHLDPAGAQLIEDALTLAESDSPS